jgi:hypothetical protein
MEMVKGLIKVDTFIRISGWWIAPAEPISRLRAP